MGNARLWLRSGLQVYANNRKQVNSACQPKSRKYCTHILFTASSPRVEEKTKVTLQTQSCLRGARTNPTAPPYKKKTTKVTLYLQDDYLHYSQMIQKKSLCAFPLLLHSMMSVKQRKKRWVHSFNPQKQVFLRPS